MNLIRIDPEMAAHLRKKHPRLTAEDIASTYEAVNRWCEIHIDQRFLTVATFPPHLRSLGFLHFMSIHGRNARERDGAIYGMWGLTAPYVKSEHRA